GYGTVKIHLSKKKTFMLEDVLYAPKAHMKLLSVRQIVSKHAQIKFTETACHITLVSGEQIQARVYGGVYMFTTIQPSVAMTARSSEVTSQDWVLWHNRLGHPSIERQRMVLQKLLGVSVTPPEN